MTTPPRHQRRKARTSDPARRLCTGRAVGLSGLTGLVLAAPTAGLAALAVLLMLGGETFPIGPQRLPMAYALTPVAGLAVFQLVFGMLTGRWRGGRYWLVALPVSALIWGTGLVLLLEGLVRPAHLLAGQFVAHTAVAGLAIWRDGPAR
ncbi:MAG: hypothetical protein P3W94_006685 [Paracoccus sp. (in: a-proteobacteria)]|nr:hypothetical protein [Paracoccus sp. (in: a-proteobacteria)]